LANGPSPSTVAVGSGLTAVRDSCLLGGNADGEPPAIPLSRNTRSPEEREPDEGQLRGGHAQCGARRSFAGGTLVHLFSRDGIKPPNPNDLPRASFPLPSQLPARRLVADVAEADHLEPSVGPKVTAGPRALREHLHGNVGDAEVVDSGDGGERPLDELR